MAVSDIKSPLARWLERKCAETDLKQSGLARRLKISPAFLSALRRDRRQWPPRVLDLLPPEWLPDAAARRWVQAAALVSGPELRLPLTGLSLKERERLLAWLLAEPWLVDRLNPEGATRA